MGLTFFENFVFGIPLLLCLNNLGNWKNVATIFRCFKNKAISRCFKKWNPLENYDTLFYTNKVCFDTIGVALTEDDEIITTRKSYLKLFNDHCGDFVNRTQKIELCNPTCSRNTTFEDLDSARITVLVLRN